MSSRKLFVFKHDNALGNAHAQDLFDLIEVARKNPAEVARSFDDYVVSVNHSAVPEGVTLIERL